LPSVAFNKFDCFVADCAHKVHNLGSDALYVMLSNVIPLASNTVKANITQIAAGNGYATDGNPATLVSSAQSSGLYKLILNDPTLWTAGPAAMALFQYAVLYNFTAAAGPLIGWWNYGSAITLNIGDTFLVDLSAVNGVLTLQ
jgi:hypothetical protein